MYNKICVAVRKRPLNAKEFSNGDHDVVPCETPRLTVCEPKVKYDLTKYVEKHSFEFDEVLDVDCTNSTVYSRTAQPLVETACSGGTGTCFAYGQTGTGKTHTMLGKETEPGLFLFAAMDLFSTISKMKTPYDVSVSFFEIYGGKIFDLLNGRKKLVCREDAELRVNICGLTEHVVKNEREIMKIIETGSLTRASGATSANDTSSRSHAILIIDLRNSSGKQFGRLCFVDLAGNERGADTANCDRFTRMEGAEINKSLLALKECIRALGMGKSHIPFRGSVLTEVLKDCFTATNCRTVMIANISPSSTNCEHTLNTLRYSDRVKEIRKGGGPAGKGRQRAQEPQAKKPERVARPDWKGAGNDDVAAIIQNHRKDLDDNEEAMAEESEGAAEVEAVHAHLVGSLRREEGEVLVLHRYHIEQKMECVRAEVAALQHMDLPRSNIDEYVARADAALVKEMQLIQDMRHQLQRMQLHLKEEEVLSRTFTPHFYA